MTPEEYVVYQANLRARVAALGDGWIYIGDRLFERGDCVELWDDAEGMAEYPRVVNWDPDKTDGDYIAWRLWKG